MSTTRFLVRKDQLPRTEWEIEPDAPLQDGEVRVRIDRFAADVQQHHIRGVW